MMGESSVNTDKNLYNSELPENPVVIIEPDDKFLNLRELWKYSDLFYVLTVRDIKVRYKQTVLGILWAILQPLSMMIIFTLFFGRLAAIPSDGLPYPVFVFSGLLPWTFFSNSLNTSTNSLAGNTALITKVYFPRMIIPFAAIGAGLVDFVIAFALLILLMIYYGIGLSINILMLPVLTFLTMFFTAGLGLYLSALNVKYRDIRYAVPFAIQILMFITPIIYPSSLVPEKWRWLLKLNPLTGIIEGYRSAIFGTSFDFMTLGISTFMIFIIFFYSTYLFRQMERDFADVI